MEKLLTLLNEYECHRSGYDVCTGWQEKDGRVVWVTDDPRPQVRSEYYILSKEYGFIEWLLTNNKINEDNLESHMGRSYIQKDCPIYDFILISLADSETPVKDLITYYLK